LLSALIFASSASLRRKPVTFPDCGAALSGGVADPMEFRQETVPEMTSPLTVASTLNSKNCLLTLRTNVPVSRLP
jgi:hypothetical protein